MIGESSNILFVDDEPANLIAFRAAFRRDFTVFTAESAIEALEILKKYPIKVIVTDQKMPDTTGVEFLESIIPAYPEVIRIILTGYSDIEAIIRAINSGRVFRYITKPWNEFEFRLILDSAIKIYDLEKKNKELLSTFNEELSKYHHAMELFKQYVPSNILNELLYSSEVKCNYGEQRTITVLFADICNFTKLIAHLDPNHIVSFLNDYFSKMSVIVEKHKGVISKFLGDGFYALFGAPVYHLNDQRNAIDCALEMIEILNEINERYGDIFEEKIQIGIGINTGEAVVGNIGSTGHMIYSAIGDILPFTTQIERLAKEIPNTILISEGTYNDVKHEIAVQEFSSSESAEKIKLYKVIKTVPNILSV